MSLPLEGIKILDVSRGIAASFCTMILAEYGAEVIKIEGPGGDTIRYMPPLFEGMGTHFIALNRNKRSIELNINSDSGREEFLKLVKTSDAVVENFRPGVLEKMNLGYEELKKANNRIILCSVSSFGQDGEWKDKPCHDINLIGLSGFLSGFTSPSGNPPVPVPFLAAMAGGSMWAVIGILMALRQRDSSGTGMHVDVSMFDGLLSLMLPELVTELCTGEPQLPGFTWNSGPAASCNVYRTKDGRWITLGCIEPKFWKNFCDAFDRQDLLPHGFPHFEKREWVLEEVRTVMSSYTMEEIMKINSRVDILAEPVNTLTEALKAVPAVEKNIAYSISNNNGGKNIPQIRLPLKFQEKCPENAPPQPGEHGKL